MAFNSMDACPMDQSIPQWKRELILRRRALGRTLQVGNSTVKLTCPAVVAVVRQPESIGTGILDNITTFKPFQSSCQDEKSTSTLCSLNQGSLHPEDFHPCTQSSSNAAESVDDMRILDISSDVNSLINGSDVISKQSECSSRPSSLSMKYNLIMGEDKLVNKNKMSLSSRSKLDCNGCVVVRHHHLKNGVPVDQMSNRELNGLGLSAKEDDSSSDSSEELQYGPGIVNKLKSKYLSMTLREKKRSSRPSIINQLRRATSLENILEATDNLNPNGRVMSSKDSDFKTEKKVNKQAVIVGQTVGLNSHHGLKFLEKRSLETMKRARSMETLLKAEAKVLMKNTDSIPRPTPNVQLTSDKNLAAKNNLHANYNKPIASIVNENVVIVESLNSNIGTSTSTLNNTCKQDSESLSKQLPNQCVINGTNIHTELPPPDLVKQTLKIFETSPKKRTNPSNTTQNSLSKLVVNLEISCAAGSNPKPMIPNCRPIERNIRAKPILSPKPILTPEKLKQSRSKIVSPKKLNRPSANLKLNCGSNHQSLSNNKKPDKKNVPEISRISCEGSGIGEKSPKPVVSVIAEPSTFVDSPSNLQISSQTVCDRVDSFNLGPNQVAENLLNTDEEIDGGINGVGNDCTKPIPQSALENIRSNGGTVHYSFQTENSQNKSGPKSYLPTTKSAPQALNTSLLNQSFDKSPTVVANISPLRPISGTGTKQVGIIRPLVTSKTQSSLLSSSILTDQEIEKNIINCVKSIEQPISKVVVSIKALPDNVVLGSVSSDIVSNKNISLPDRCSNSNSKTQTLWDEKLWQQTQNTIVFNFSDRKEVPDYIENDGLILKAKRDRPRPGEGGGCDESYTDTEDVLTCDPPSPCDVTFEGDNVLINGKSNLKKSPKQVKLRIKFNDEATTMFEYPSEASLVEEEESASSDTPNISQSSLPLGPSLPQALGGGGSLGAYTPRKTGAEEWQLGMTPVLPLAPPPPRPDQEHLSPAPLESTTAWSEDTASDLLF